MTDRSIKILNIYSSIILCLILFLYLLLLSDHNIILLLLLMIWPIFLIIFLLLGWLLTFFISILTIIFKTKELSLKITGIPFILNIVSALIIFLSQYNSWSNYLTDDNIVVTNRYFSPNNRNIAITYKINLGATGSSSEKTAVLPVHDTLSNLRYYLLNDEYSPISWKNDSTLFVKKYHNNNSINKEGYIKNIKYIVVK